MSGKFFLDTNVLVYAAENGSPDPEKSAIALELIGRSGGTISTQVLGEFYWASTNRRRPNALSHESALEWIQLWLSFDIEPVTLETVRTALGMVERYGVAYYDALILAFANLSGCEVVYTEDSNYGQRYGKSVVKNPFRSP